MVSMSQPEFAARLKGEWQAGFDSGVKHRDMAHEAGAPERKAFFESKMRDQYQAGFDAGHLSGRSGSYPSNERRAFSGSAKRRAPMYQGGMRGRKRARFI